MPQGAGRALVLVGWAVVGALTAFGLAAVFTPFLLLLLPAGGLALVLTLRGGVDRRVWAALAGAAIVPAWLAWSDASPWPGLVALVMVVLGLGLARRRPARVPSARTV